MSTSQPSPAVTNSASKTKLPTVTWLAKHRDCDTACPWRPHWISRVRQCSLLKYTGLKTALAGSASFSLLTPRYNREGENALKIIKAWNAGWDNQQPRWPLMYWPAFLSLCFSPHLLTLPVLTFQCKQKVWEAAKQLFSTCMSPLASNPSVLTEAQRLWRKSTFGMKPGNNQHKLQALICFPLRTAF